MARAFLLVLDSFGVGAAPDAERFGDVGADTLSHIADWCASGHTAADRPQAGPLALPNMVRLGLGRAAALATGRVPEGLAHEGPVDGVFAACAELSNGKDTPSGHWEMAGVPVRFDWGYFPRTVPAFPDSLITDLVARCDLPGVLGNCHASGTEIIARLGDEHVRTGKPIVYTSADSVFQIAAHEEHFGLARLYDMCETARDLVDPYNIGRVIARPFVGADGSYVRTGNRRDLATPPPADTLLDRLTQAGRTVISVGKIADIFAHRGIGPKYKATGLDALFDTTLDRMADAPDGALTFVNFVDFDQEYGHRRNVAGYADALERFDARLPELHACLKEGDLVVMTADHGCDPTWQGTDHTREFVPLIAFGPGVAGGDAGRRDSFADVGQTVARHLGIDPLPEGVSVL
ncbi:phosphopentomutase [Eilatimonas milleporae]|uniref:Phosphopentomutase n=1 Tax=Eilatimonas milleporae TaxID=911205 RepID=A0A3M0CW59_9PROT|nr:phosphopentomutase [Eilatimonas milleporae]RMB13065.1 phosphopentomutase [Eilatimonas milleporae]